MYIRSNMPLYSSGERAVRRRSWLFHQRSRNNLWRNKR